MKINTLLMLALLSPAIFFVFLLAISSLISYILLVLRNKQNKTQTNTMTQNKLKQLIDQTNGKFFSCSFIKADGTLRVANGKDFYVRLLAGGESTLKNSKSTAFVDRNKERWIAAHDERLIEFKCGKIRHTF